MELKVNSINFGYDENRKVIKDVSFEFSASQILCILGANGTGKSTLLKCLIGEEKANGDILIDGKNIKEYNTRQLAQKFAYIPQTTDATFSFRVIDVILMGRTAYIDYFGTPDQSDIDLAIEKMNFLGIGYLKEKLFNEISGGERQLVMIAAAMTQEPELMIFDEPTAHLDFGNSYRFLDLVKKLQQKGIGIIMTTHFPEHALFLKGDTLILKDGLVMSKGKADDIITEKNMSKLYGIEVNIREIEDRIVCIPGKMNPKTTELFSNNLV